MGGTSSPSRSELESMPATPLHGCIVPVTVAAARLRLPLPFANWPEGRFATVVMCDIQELCAAFERIHGTCFTDTHMFCTFTGCDHEERLAIAAHGKSVLHSPSCATLPFHNHHRCRHHHHQQQQQQQQHQQQQHCDCY